MIKIKGRGVIGGIAEGIALVAPDSIQGWSGINELTGEIIERGHVEEGESVANRILVLPGSKGSNGWSGHFHSTKVNCVAPSGWIFSELDSRVGVAGVVMNIPMVVELEKNPFDYIESGDWVRVNGDEGLVEIMKK